MTQAIASQVGNTGRRVLQASASNDGGSTRRTALRLEHGLAVLLVSFSSFAVALEPDKHGESVSGFSLTVAPMATVCQREGITGSGWAVAYEVAEGPRRLQKIHCIYPNHPDDWGKTTGTGSAFSTDGGLSWTAGPDNTPIPGMLDMWQDRLPNGELIAFGIRSVPERRKALDIPADAHRKDQYVIGISKDQGRTWLAEPAAITATDSIGVIARPLPRIVQSADGTLCMPAYAWSKTGHRALWLKSVDHGRNWQVASVIAAAEAMRACGAPPTAAWLETAVARTADGNLLAVVRSGSSAQSAMVTARSTDNGATWSPVEKLLAGPSQRIVPGKMPGLCLLPNGVLVLLTAHTKDHCRIYLSSDGTGRQWSDGHIITSQSGGNTSMVGIGFDKLLVITPASVRIAAWQVTVNKQDKAASRRADASPRDVRVACKGLSICLSWLPPVDGAQVDHYLVTPVLVKPSEGNQDMEIYSYVPIKTPASAAQLELGRVLAFGATYRFEVAAVDRQGRISKPAVSAERAVGPSAGDATR